jgi:hypothetical protein
MTKQKQPQQPRQEKPLDPNKVWDVISPDGFSIHCSDTYDTEQAAREAFKVWAKQYEKQGYYSSSRWGRINLHSLEINCVFIQIDKPEAERQPMYENEMCRSVGLRATCNSCDRIIFEDENWKEDFSENGGYCPECFNSIQD